MEQAINENGVKIMSGTGLAAVRERIQKAMEEARALGPTSVPSNAQGYEQEFVKLHRDLAVDVPEVDFGAETQRLVEECADRYAETPTYSEEPTYVRTSSEPLNVLYEQCLTAVKRQKRIST